MTTPEDESIDNRPRRDHPRPVRFTREVRLPLAHLDRTLGRQNFSIPQRRRTTAAAVAGLLFLRERGGQKARQLGFPDKQRLRYRAPDAPCSRRVPLRQGPLPTLQGLRQDGRNQGLKRS